MAAMRHHSAQSMVPSTVGPSSVDTQDPEFFDQPRRQVVSGIGDIYVGQLFKTITRSQEQKY